MRQKTKIALDDAYIYLAIHCKKQNLKMSYRLSETCERLCTLGKRGFIVFYIENCLKIWSYFF